jgi:hypothetical protein
VRVFVGDTAADEKDMSPRPTAAALFVDEKSLEADLTTKRRNFAEVRIRG